MADGRWPDLPVGVKSGIAVRVGDTAYVGLGSAGTDFFSLDLADPSEGWVKRAAFDGPATNGAAAAFSGGRIYVFSGSGKPTPDAASPVIFDTVHVYDTAADAWSTVDTTTPAGLLGAKALSLSDGRIAIIGGYNKQQFDKYLADVAATDKEKDPEGFRALVEAYMGREPEAYGWNDAVLAYDPAANSWSTLGENPYLPNTDSAVVPRGGDAFLVIGGEIKPGLRTPQAKSIAVDGDTATWEELAEMPAPAGEAVQEGVAGAYAGETDGTVLIAGGANFPGARANSEAGKMVRARRADQVLALRGLCPDRRWLERGGCAAAGPRLRRGVLRSRRPALRRRRGRRGQPAHRGLRSEMGRERHLGRRLTRTPKRQSPPGGIISTSAAARA